MDKKKKLAGRIGRLIISVLVITITIILLGTMIVSFRQTARVYDERTTQAAKLLSEMLDGDRISELLSLVDDDAYRAVRDAAEAEDDEQRIVDYLTEQYGPDSPVEMVERYNAALEKFRDDWAVRFLYVSVIQGDYSIDLLDADTGLFALGYKAPLMEKFKSLNGNEAVAPTVTLSDYGWLSSGGVPILDSDGNAVAIAFCDISMDQVVRDTLVFVGIILAVSVVIVLLTSLLINRMVRRTITAPIEDLTAAANRFAANENGEYTHDDVADLDIHTGDEIEVLYNATRSMQMSLIDYMDNLTRVTAEKERISAELHVATQIQAGMLPCIFPPFPNHSEFDIFASMTPAKEVGGDFYDFFLIDEDHLGIVMADVSGKGVPAALFMVIAKTLIKNEAQACDYSPAKILRNVNEQLCESNEAELFVTVWLAILELSTGRGMAANAGHEHPALCRAGGRYELVEYRHSPAVATMSGIRFREHPFELRPGDRLFVYTDGVAEATDANNELFGAKRMLDALNRDPAAPLYQTLANVQDEINAFVGDAPQFDDITMLCLSYRGPQGDPS